jgi:geranylgeranyl pyrophosphate synthase
MRGVAEGSPDALRTTIEAGIGGSEHMLGHRVALSAAGVTGEADAVRAATAIGLLEAAQYLRASVHGLESTNPGRRDSGDNVAAGLGSAWLSARSVELAAELGGAASLRLSKTLPTIADGWILEALDLYDAGRSPERCIQAASATRGALYSLAAALGGLAAGLAPAEVEILGRCGETLGASSKACDDARSLVPALEPTDQVGSGIAGGVYGLPVAYAVQAEPKLAEALGGAVKEKELDDLVARIGSAGGPAQTAVYCGRVSSDAAELVDGLDRGEAFAALAAEIADRCEEAALA